MVEEMQYRDIEHNDKLLNEYKLLLEQLRDNTISKKIVDENYGKSIIDIYNLIEEAYIKNTSHYIFPSNLVYIYPKIIEYKASKKYISDFSGSIIMPGQYYINYRPLIINVSTNTRYVLKNTIRCELTYKLPSNIVELDEFMYNVDNEIDNYDDIDYNYLKQNGKNILQKLRSGRK